MTLQLFLLAALGALITFALTLLVMPRVIMYMQSRNIVGIDVHKLDKPKIAEMGGLGLLIGVTGGCIVLFVGSGFLGFGYFDYRILIFLAVILLAGLVGVIDDLKNLGPKIKPLLTALACLPIILPTWIIGALGIPITPTYDPRPRLPFLGRTRLTIVYLLIIPFGIAVPSNAVNMLDVFNGVMPLTTILMFIATLIVSLILLSAGVPNAELGVILSCVMLGALIAYYYFNRYPARVFAGDTGSLAIGAALGALAIMGGLEIVAIVALLPAIMNAFYSLVSIGGLLERRQMRGRPTIFQKDGTLTASQEANAPLTLTRLVLARGPLKEQQIIRSLTLLSLASSTLAVMTIFLIPLDTLIFLISWPLSLSLIAIPIILVCSVYFILRKNDSLGIRLAGLITIMIGVWVGGMAGFWLLDILVAIEIPGLEVVLNILRAFLGMVFILGWLFLWHLATRIYFKYERRKAPLTTMEPAK